VHSDSTESVVEDTMEVCEKNLLSHILRAQADVSDRLDKIEEEITSTVTGSNCFVLSIDVATNSLSDHLR